MKQERPTSSKGYICEGEEAWIHQLNGNVKLGDLIWVRISGSSWWPAQVADANTVSESMKPCKRSVGEILVRLYGSYEYLFVNPMKFRSEFEQVLKHSSCREILNTSLEKECPRFNPSGPKGKGYKSGEKIKVQISTARKLKRSLLENNQAIVAVESKIGMLEGSSDIDAWFTRGQKGSLGKDVSDDKRITQRSIKYLVNAGPYAKGSPRKRLSPTMENDGFTILTHQVEKKPKASPMTPTSVPSLLKKSQELSDRRMKVMRSLGLVAPSESPFRRIGQIYPYCD